jgi:hypothetical protein
MEKKIKESLLEDLYNIDSNLKKEEEKLLIIIDNILKAKNDIHYNEEFFDKLKEKVLIEIQKQKYQTQKKYYFFQRLSYSLAFISLVLLIFLVSPVFKNNEEKIVEEINNTRKISMLAPQAFGDLSLVSDNKVEGLGSGEIGLMPIPEFTKSYRFFLKEGENINFDNSSNLVYQQINTKDYFIDQASLPFAVDNFGNLKYSFVNFQEDKNNPFSLSINFLNQSLSINKETINTEIKVNEFKEETTINLANQFINAYEISLEDYGDAYINKYWSDEEYIPSRVQVLYPQIIDDLFVYNQRGEYNSMQVDVSLHLNEVVGLYNYSFADYQASQYDIIDTKEQILEYLVRLNEESIFTNDTIDVYLSEAKFALLKTNVIENAYSKEIYVPAIVFKADNYYQDSLVIPLISDN